MNNGRLTNLILALLMLSSFGCARIQKSKFDDRQNQWIDTEEKDIPVTVSEEQTDQNPEISNEVTEPRVDSKEEEETTTGITQSNSQSSKTVGGKILPLNIRDSEPRFLSPELLVRSIAQYFNFGSSVIPKNCTSSADFLQFCTNSAEQDFCVQSHRSLANFYCNIGGEAREKSSFLGASYTAGDLLSQWSLATALCNTRGQDSESNLAATHLGIGYNQNKVSIAEKLVRKFLPGIVSDNFNKEVEFIAELLGYSAESESFFDTPQGRRELAQGFADACSYLIIHPIQLTY